ncbi:MAG: RNA polymerase factor sigma-54 [Bdellovibrionales bacterium]|nr:RNA polymerase factor sigma-54 [Bdellovibrionales bacterium]
MKMNMSMKLSQSLRMTPQLQQAIKLLQLSRLELENEVRKELIENPVLEEVQDTMDDDPASHDSQLAEEVINPDQNSKEDQDPTKQDEFDWDSYMESQNKPMQSMAGGAPDEILNYENMVSETKTLYDHLMWQVGLSGFNDEEENLMAILVSYVNDDGYISRPLEEIAADEEVDAKELEEMLPFLHEFDPAGVGARNLQECLLIQAKHIQEDTHDLVKIINEHIKDLEKKNYPAIAKTMGVELEVVIDLCKIILAMDPKPGRAFMTSDTHYIMPDVYVYKVGEEYVVSLNEDGLPRLRVSNLYRNLLKTELEEKKAKTSNKANKDAQEYIQDKLRSAIWLIKSIHQRQRTIYKVTESIVRHQGEFFEKGASAIKPMILRDIANDIGMHESTVSRVTTNKYVHTPQGIFELKYFFNSGISKTDGDSVASESVKLKIRDLVDKENPKSPLSDQKIVELLKKDGIKIARRTVAKYRDVLKILPSSKRKKYF